jgi:hypothetical protein
MGEDGRVVGGVGLINRLRRRFVPPQNKEKVMYVLNQRINGNSKVSEIQLAQATTKSQ